MTTKNPDRNRSSVRRNPYLTNAAGKRRGGFLPGERTVFRVGGFFGRETDFESELSMLFVNYLDMETRQRLLAADAAGDICMRFFDRNGMSIKDGLRGVIGISLEQLRRVPNVIAVSSGSNKAHAILSAIKGKIIQTLITDDLTAQSILTLLKEGKNDK